jgi:hypothetical protein
MSTVAPLADTSDTPELQVAEQSAPSAAIHAGRTPITIDHPQRYQQPDGHLRQSLNQSRHVSFVIDEDMILAAQDQARSMCISWDAWCQQVLNDALRTYLGV